MHNLTPTIACCQRHVFSNKMLDIKKKTVIFTSRPWRARYKKRKKTNQLKCLLYSNRFLEYTVLNLMGLFYGNKFTNMLTSEVTCV